MVVCENGGGMKPDTKRTSLEREIRQLSLKLYNLRGRCRGEENSDVDNYHEVLDEFIDAWYKLKKYYEQKAYESSLQEDTEISLFVVNCYLTWIDLLGNDHLRAMQLEKNKEMLAISEALSVLEHHMRDILNTLTDFDEFGLE
jgi:hypothetical protein